MNYEIIGKPVLVESGLVDFEAPGIYNGTTPCRVGFIMGSDGETIATHIFITDCVLADGTCCESATIKL